MRLFYIIMVFSFLVAICTSLKEVTIFDGNQDVPIQYAIKDFIQTGNKEFKQDSVFYVNAKNINSEILGIGIFGTYDKVVVITEDRINYSYRAFPTGYIEKDGKFFYWHDSTKNTIVTDTLISTLIKYNILDTMIVNAYIPESTIEHFKKGMDYYFCRNNLLKYKKVRTSIAMGYYKPPKLNCKCKP